MTDSFQASRVRRWPLRYSATAGAGQTSYHRATPGTEVFLALFASVWWSWVNLTYTVNVQIGLTRRALAAYMFAAMAATGAIAVAAPQAIGERAWLFALGTP
ncbi:low temperature requirement protein A [Microbacterium panaciterrae]|uniref:Uncharacterized protein n=1 Tax=Microbacterium panaciterrae TaxID=985759 RepID=A0ABP8P9X3_9MICO